MELTQNYLKECLDYNELTGVFTWRERPLSHFRTARGMNVFNSKCANKEAGTISDKGYLAVKINDKSFKCHRLAWLYVHGVMPENYTDHINGVKNDNRIINLREATNGENCQNLKKAQKNNKCGLLGVSFHKRHGSYCAQIVINRKTLSLGYFKTPDEAHQAYINAKRELHGYNTL